MENEMKDKKETLRRLGMEELFRGLEEQGWHPMLCDTPVPVYDNAVPCGKPADVGDVEKEYKLMPEETVSLQPGFMVKAKGDSMKDAGIFDGDRVIIDKAVEPHNGSIVVAFWNGEFTMKYLDLTHKSDGYIELRPANPDYPVFKVEAGDNFEVWGTVIHLIRTFEKF